MSHDPDIPDPKQLVAQGYDRVADTYSRLEEEIAWPRMRWLHQLLDLLPQGSSVLDLGCGSGDPADIALARHHHVTGVDSSEVQITKARQNVPSGTFLQADLGSVAFAPASFDAVVSFYSIEHLPREEHGLVFTRVASWLRPGGHLLLGTEAAETEGTIGTWLGVPMYFSSHGPETVRRLIEQAGLVMRDVATELQMEQGREIPYLWILAHKEAAHVTASPEK